MPDENRRLQLANWSLPAEVVSYYEDQGVKEMFQWQAQCLLTGNALKGGNLLYSAPTSAGKTLVAEILALKRVLKTKRKAIFILPFVSVAREKMFSMRKLYSRLGLRVGGFMGAHTPPGGFAKVDVAVCTIERANSLLNRLLEAGNLSCVSVIVVDELHMIGDESRGCLLEPLLTKINFYQHMIDKDSEEDRSIQIIGMSATLPNMHVLARWLKADLYCTDFRPVPLTEYVKIGARILDNQLEFVRDIQVPGSYENDADLIVNLCLETVLKGCSVLIFCPTKSWCENLSMNIAKSFYTLIRDKKPELKNLWEELEKSIDKPKILELLERLERCPAGLSSQLKQTLLYITSHHHAGLTMEEKDVIEAAFKSSVIRVLISTTTLSSGVNLPAQRVIIRSPMFLGRVIDTLTYKQMAGRAGRKGIDTSGESVLICKENEKATVRNLLSSNLRAATSQLILRADDGTYQLRSSVKRALLEVVASGTASTIQVLNTYIGCTLLAAEVEASGSAHMEQLVDKCLNSLTKDEFIQIVPSDSGDQIVATQLGRAVFASSMNPDDSLMIFKDLSRSRKSFVLENELHMVYQVTPLSGMSETIDWMRYLNIWDSLPSDQKLVGELVGVSERFIVLNHQNKRRRDPESQRRAMFSHRRFYTALVLHDLINEVPLSAVERKYGINKGSLQALQQQAAIFAGMICTFCSKLSWTPLELLLTNFQQRLDLGVKSELVDLIRVESLDGKKARYFYDSGLRSVAEMVTAGPDKISRILQNYLPFESSKRSDGETEWETHERTARRVYITGRSSLTISEASALIYDEAKKVLEVDLSKLGVVLPANQNNSSVADSTNQDGISRSLVNSTPNASTPSLPSPQSQATDRTSSTPHIFSQLKLNSSTKTATTRHEETTTTRREDIIVIDSQEPHVSEYQNLLNTFEVVATRSRDNSNRNSIDSDVQDGDSGASTDKNGIPSKKGKATSKPAAKNTEISASPSTSKLLESTQSFLKSMSENGQNEIANVSSWSEMDFSPDVSNHSNPTDFNKKVDELDRILHSTNCKSSSSDRKVDNSNDSVPPAKRVKRQLTSFTRLKKSRVRTSTIDTSKVKALQLQDATTPTSTTNLSGAVVSSSSRDSSSVLWSPLNDSVLLAHDKSDGKSSAALENIPSTSKVGSGKTTPCRADRRPSIESNKDPSHSDSDDLFKSSASDGTAWSPLSIATGITTPSHASQSSVNDVPSPDPPTEPANDKPTTSLPVTPAIASTSRNTSLDSSLAVEEVSDNWSANRVLEKIDMVDVTASALLFRTFIKDWSKSGCFSLSLACRRASPQEKAASQSSIGFKESASSNGSVRDDSGLSTSAVTSAEGVLLHQFNSLVVGLAVCLEGGTVFYVDLTHPDSTKVIDSRLQAISFVLCRDSQKLMFDSKAHMKRLTALLKIAQLSRVLDPKVAIWMLDPGDKECNLVGAVTKYAPLFINLVHDMGACFGTGSIGLNSAEGTSPRLRSCLEAIAVRGLMTPLLTILKSYSLSQSFESIEMPHLACLARMECSGFGFDVEELRRQSAYIRETLSAIEQECTKYVGRRWDLSSPKDVGQVLFVELKLPFDGKRVKGKRAPWSTAHAQLEKIKHLHPLPGMIIAWRKLKSTLVTLIEPLDETKVWSDERRMYRVYCNCSIHTSTGRITMSDPNLQTMRKDFNVELKDIPGLTSGHTISLRNMFYAPTGYVLLSADYSQLELRLISHLAQDPTLVQLLNKGGDVFKDIASRWKNVPVAEVTEEQRQHAKQTIVFS